MQALPPGSTIGILGGGQLGRMLILAAARLGFKCHVYTDNRGWCHFESFLRVSIVWRIDVASLTPELENSLGY